MSVEGWVIAVVGAALVAAGLVRLWADRSRLGDYQGRHRDDEDNSKR